MFILRHPDDLSGFDDLIDDDVNLDALADDSKDDDDDDADIDENNVALFLKYREDNRPTKLDACSSSKEDHRYMSRCTKKDAEDHLKKMLVQMRKPIIKPFAIIKDFQYKKKASDSDIPDPKGKNVEEDFLLVIGRLPKWKNIMHQLDERPYILGECMYVHRGKYDIGVLKPHFALKINKKYKTIKPMEIRDCFDPIKATLQNGAPYVIYKEFPKRQG